MNILQLKRQLKKRKENKHYEIKPIGSAIRIKRKEMNMTLEEGADGICSVSYLSKLETNQIDPNMDFVERLVERFDLKEKIAYNQEQYEKDLTTMTDWLIHLKEPDIDLLGSYDERKDHQAYLIGLLLNTMRKQKADMGQAIRLMHPFIPHLKHEELVLFLLCVCELLLIEEHLIDAYHVVCDIPDQHESCYDHYILALRLRLIIAFRMHHDVEIHLHYHHYLQEVNHQGYYHLAKEMRQYELIYLAHSLSPEAIKRIQQTSDRYFELGSLPLALSSFIHQKYDDVIKLAEQQTNYQGWIFIYLVSLYHQGYVDEIKAMIEHHQHHDFDPSEHLFMKWMHLKINHPSESLPQLIKQNFHFENISIDHPIIIEYIMKDIAYELSHAQYYKDAYHLLSHHFRKTKSLKKSYTLTLDEA